MTAKDLFELSGIQEDPNYLEMDYAVPFDAERKEYPHNGRAVSIYWKDGKFEIVSHYDLACRAQKNLKAKFREMMNKLANYENLSRNYRLEMYRTYCKLDEIDEVKRSCLEMQSTEKV